MEAKDVRGEHMGTKKIMKVVEPGFTGDIQRFPGYYILLQINDD